MTKNEDKIHIRLELSRDKNSGNLTILTHFDEKAPNVKKDDRGYSWWPTPQEREFLNEAFDMMTPSKTKHPSQEKPPETKTPSELSKSEEVIPPIEKPDEEPTYMPAVEGKDNESSFGQEKGKIVEADEAAIERALQKKLAEERKYHDHPDEETIIDKVLSQKKKGLLRKNL